MKRIFSGLRGDHFDRVHIKTRIRIPKSKFQGEQKRGFPIILSLLLPHSPIMLVHFILCPLRFKLIFIFFPSLPLLSLSPPLPLSLSGNIDTYYLRVFIITFENVNESPNTQQQKDSMSGKIFKEKSFKPTDFNIHSSFLNTTAFALQTFRQSDNTSLLWCSSMRRKTVSLGWRRNPYQYQF